MTTHLVDALLFSAGFAATAVYVLLGREVPSWMAVAFAGFLAIQAWVIWALLEDKRERGER